MSNSTRVYIKWHGPFVAQTLLLESGFKSYKCRNFDKSSLFLRYMDEIQWMLKIWTSGLHSMLDNSLATVALAFNYFLANATIS